MPIFNQFGPAKSCIDFYLHKPIHKRNILRFKRIVEYSVKVPVKKFFFLAKLTVF